MLKLNMVTVYNFPVHLVILLGSGRVFNFLKVFTVCVKIYIFETFLYCSNQ